ncbi:MAG: hypothetical protein KF862_17750 [Chitinophagaceae bacterium]|nr:hypothetical protein [Chitinophagaceae bacterium]
MLTLFRFSLLLTLLHGGQHLFAQNKTVTVNIEWNQPALKGSIAVTRGVIKELQIVKGKGKVKGDAFEITGDKGLRIRISLENTNLENGPEPTVVAVKVSGESFSFFVRDVNKNYPIYIPGYRVVVLPGADNRTYAAVELEILRRKTKTKIQHISDEKETSFEEAAKDTRNMSAPVWLGTGRDMRIFEISENLPDASAGEANIISPKLSSSPLRLEAIKNGNANYLYTMGRGVGVRNTLHRRLEEGVLPILHSTLVDDDVEYNTTAFVALEKSPLQQQKGTDFLVADQHSAGHMFTEGQLEQLKTRTPAALNTTEETVLIFRSTIINKGPVPRYAWFKIPRPGTTWWMKSAYAFENKNGFSLYDSGKVFCVSRLNGKPLSNEEMALLLQPDEKAVIEFYLPHSPVSRERAATLASLNYDQKFQETKNFWLTKLQTAASIHVPEKRINEMIQAGLLHLDLITFGNEPGGTLAPNIGVYSPIGTESAPIIQFYASMGKTEEARRSLNYFLDKQHENGFIQNFGGYMVETGAALWSMGEYFRYTRDVAWAGSVKDKLIKSCDFLIDWRNKNKREELKGRGYGMIDGKVADPEDHFHQFMLNGYAYLGMSRVAEILKDIDAAEYGRIKSEADAWKEDIRASFFTVTGISPVVPLGDGTWWPTVPPWTEADGLRALYSKKEIFWSHGTFTAPDALLSPMYLVFCEVLDPFEAASKNMLSYHSELFYQGNAVFSQPYYSRHNWLQARLGMVKAFLNTYYYTVSAHADRETYTFWEHMFKASPHKTHEEAWFLMETRWMLYMENGDTLSLFRTIPRKWMEDGKTIALNEVRSYFGKLNVKVASQVNKGFIEATVSGEFNSKPRTVTVRLPHPEGKEPVKVTGGAYDKKTEAVIINGFTGESKITVQY